MADRLLDTNAVSAAMAGNNVFLRYLARIAEDGLLLTSVTVEGEIHFGISRLSEGRKKQTLNIALLQILGALHDILPITREVAARYVEIKSDLWALGKPMGENDLWIAATALAHNLRLVTNDESFTHVKKLSVEDWMHS